jgi:bloom syndrome protein
MLPLPAWCCPGLSVVILPLLSLIQDRVQIMTELGIQAVFLNSAQDYVLTEQRDIQRPAVFVTSAHGVVTLSILLPRSCNIQGYKILC